LKEDELKHFSSIWLLALVGWTGLLWTLSSLEGGVGPDLFQHFDKLQHFCYFLTGGVLFAGWRYTRAPESPVWRNIVLLTMLVMGIIGALDEAHQMFTPGRSGGDPWDWLADLAGSCAGALVFKSFHHRLK
jgi:VanZ family protein